MRCESICRLSVKTATGFSGLVFVATSLSACSGDGSSATKAGSVVPTLMAVNLDEDVGPQTPPCGIFEVIEARVVDGQRFPKGIYRINVFAISCDEVTGDAGLFNRFLQLEDGETLTYPWRLLKDAVGAPKFSSRPGVGFRVQIIQN